VQISTQFNVMTTTYRVDANMLLYMTRSTNAGDDEEMPAPGCATLRGRQRCPAGTSARAIARCSSAVASQHAQATASAF
jgi:hypothetical protein